MLVNDELIRYQSHLLLEGFGLKQQLLLKDSRVLCVGAGGLGSPLLLYLVAAGVGQIGIIDNDEISLGNLQRQILYCTNDIGLQKITCAKRRLADLNPTVIINTHSEKLLAENAQSVIKDYDLVADCSDNFDTKFLINDTCFNLHKIFVTASANQYRGHFAIFNPQVGPCYRCLFESLDFSDCHNCKNAGVFSPLLSILSAFQATAIISHLSGTDRYFNQLIEYDAYQLEQKKIYIKANPYCSMVHTKSKYQEEEPSFVEEIDSLNVLSGKSFKLIDVRSRAEHEMGNLGGECISLENLRLALEDLQRSTCVVLYCKTGARSRLGCEMLQLAGFKNVYSLKAKL